MVYKYYWFTVLNQELGRNKNELCCIDGIQGRRGLSERLKFPRIIKLFIGGAKGVKANTFR